MTKKEITKVLIDMFIKKFGEQEVKLTNPIVSNLHDYFKYKSIQSVRQKNGQFEFFVDCWAYGWYNDKSLISRYLLKVLKEVLDVNVKETKTISYKII